MEIKHDPDLKQSGFFKATLLLCPCLCAAFPYDADMGQGLKLRP